MRTVHLDKASRQSHAQTTLVKVLSKIGKAVLIGEGNGAQAAWLAADAVPELVFGVIAVEPVGAPFGTSSCKTNGVTEFSRNITYMPGCREYGLTDVPLTYNPPLPLTGLGTGLDGDSHQPLLNIQEVVLNGSYGQRRVWMQSEQTFASNTRAMKCRDGLGIRQLSQLKKVRHLVVTSHTSSHAVFEFATVSFMKQAGLKPVWKQLKKEGFLGNGRLMFLETNSDAIAVKISE